jgi:hypothetical protein
VDPYKVTIIGGAIIGGVAGVVSALARRDERRHGVTWIVAEKAIPGVFLGGLIGLPIAFAIDALTG